MLQWNELHPYNAVHVLRLPGPVDLERLRGVVRAVVEQRGLTGFRPEPAGFHYAGGAMQGIVRQLPAEGDALASLTHEIEAQLNTPFTFATAGEPFRFVVATEPAGSWLALGYFHPVADADAIVRLMQDIATALPRSRQPRRHQTVEPISSWAGSCDAVAAGAPVALAGWTAVGNP